MLPAMVMRLSYLVHDFPLAQDLVRQLAEEVEIVADVAVSCALAETPFAECQRWKPRYSWPGGIDRRICLTHDLMRLEP